MSPLARDSNDVDRISALPEIILFHILSFLPVGDAVSTSLLSTTWRSRWRNIHNLFFSDTTTPFTGLRELERTIRFAYFVNMVLQLINDHSIDEFSIEILVYSELYNVSSWITTAIARHVKELEFSVTDSYFTDKSISLPSCLFTCATLEVLVLRGIMSINVPDFVCLPNLEILHLEKVIFECDCCIRNLVSGCPSLDTLYVLREGYDNVLTFSVSSPTLRNLTLIFTEEYTPGLNDFTCDYKLEIDAPLLRYLTLCDSLSSDFSVENLFSLEEASINLHDRWLFNDFHQYSTAAVNLIQGVCNAKHLDLRGDIMKVLWYAGASPLFTRLTRLSVNNQSCEWTSLLRFVEFSDTLESLTFLESVHQHNLPWNNEPEYVPEWFTTCLTTVTFCKFQGMGDELLMAAFFLKFAEVLRTMTVEASEFCNTQRVLQLRQELSEFPRASEECEITVS